MKRTLSFVLFVIALLPVVALAQVGTSISVSGGMTVSEGGRGKAVGHVFDSGAGPQGSFSAAFSSGELLSITMSRLTMYSVPGSTAFFGGTAVAVVRVNGVTRKVVGEFMVMVDDLDPSHLPFPDQFFLRFDYSGGTIIRHGTFVDGDVVIGLGD